MSDQGVDVTEVVGRFAKTDADLRLRLDHYIDACRALPPKGEMRVIGQVAQVVMTRLDLRLVLDRLADECGVERL